MQIITNKSVSIMLTSDSWDNDGMLGGNAMRYAIIVLALLGVLASPRPASAAATLTGNQLLASCPAQNDNFCLGYAIGWRDAFLAATIVRNGVKRSEQDPKLGICIPDGVINSQLGKIVLKYLRDHPEKLHEPTAFLTLAAMQEAFPCR